MVRRRQFSANSDDSSESYSEPNSDSDTSSGWDRNDNFEPRFSGGSVGSSSSANLEVEATELVLLLEEMLAAPDLPQDELLARRSQVADFIRHARSGDIESSSREFSALRRSLGRPNVARRGVDNPVKAAKTINALGKVNPDSPPLRRLGRIEQQLRPTTMVNRNAPIIAPSPVQPTSKRPKIAFAKPSVLRPILGRSKNARRPPKDFPRSYVKWKTKFINDPTINKDQQARRQEVINSFETLPKDELKRIVVTKQQELKALKGELKSVDIQAAKMEQRKGSPFKDQDRRANQLHGSDQELIRRDSRFVHDTQETRNTDQLLSRAQQKVSLAAGNLSAESAKTNAIKQKAFRSINVAKAIPVPSSTIATIKSVVGKVLQAIATIIPIPFLRRIGKAFSMSAQSDYSTIRSRSTQVGTARIAGNQMEQQRARQAVAQTTYVQASVAQSVANQRAVSAQVTLQTTIAIIQSEINAARAILTASRNIELAQQTQMTLQMNRQS